MTLKKATFCLDSYTLFIESGFYYLQSRYYDPALGRFINADGYASTGDGFLGYNMFAYCNNNPRNCCDPSGNRPVWEQYEGGNIGYADSHTGRPGPKGSLANAHDLDRKSTDPTKYRCYGNAIGKETTEVPTGYVYGEPTRVTYNRVVTDLGSRNVRELSSIFDSIGDDEYIVALKCGEYDFHFIPLTSDGWYNKCGTLNGCIVGKSCILADTWYTMKAGDSGAEIVPVGRGGTEYTFETIIFAIKKDWDRP